MVKRMFGVAGRFRSSAIDRRDANVCRFSVPPTIVTTYRYVNDQRHTFDQVKKVLPSESISSFDAWKDAHFDKIFRNVTSFALEDVESLMQLIPIFPPEVYFER